MRQRNACGRKHRRHEHRFDRVPHGCDA
jgi:hypothetical protein